MQDFRIPRLARPRPPPGGWPDPRPDWLTTPDSGRDTKQRDKAGQLSPGTDRPHVLVSDRTKLRHVIPCIRCHKLPTSYSHSCFISRHSVVSEMPRVRELDTSSDNSVEEQGDGSHDRASVPIEDDEAAVESSEDEAVQAFLARRQRVDKREVTLKLQSSILNLYFNTVIGEGRWDKDARKDLANKYYLSEGQFERLSPPDLHRGSRTTTKVLLKLYQSQGSAELAMSNFVPVQLFKDDGTTKATEFTLPSLDAYKRSVDDKEIDKLLEDNDPRIIARSYLAHKKQVEAAKLTLDDTFDALEVAQRVAKLAKAQHDQNAELTWDILQLQVQCTHIKENNIFLLITQGQHDLHLKSVRETHYSKFLTSDFSHSLQTKNKAKTARRERDRSDRFFSDNLDKCVSDEADASKVWKNHPISPLFR